jgi:hypothetical protein
MLLIELAKWWSCDDRVKGGDERSKERGELIRRVKEKFGLVERKQTQQAETQKVRAEAD